MRSAWLWLRRFCWRKWNWDFEWDLQTFWCNHGGYRLAPWMDKRNPDYCWADICTDLGMARNLLGWREHARESGPPCQREANEIGCCWCGKFRNEEAFQKHCNELEAGHA